MRCLLILTLLPTLSSCVSAPPGEQLRDIYGESRSDLGAAERRELAEEVQDLLAENDLVSVGDRLLAAGVLVGSDRRKDLEVARDLALGAAEDGDPRALPIAAEAIDRLCMQNGDPQRYGTQYVFEPSTGVWSFYRWDPATTDTERRAMGIPTLGESLRRVAVLNKTD